MLTLTRKADYALISLTHMARGQGECCSAREIAERYNMPLPLLMNVLKRLARRGLTESVRGPRGGYRLALPADEIRLSDMIQAVEGPIQLTRCSPTHDEKGLGGEQRSRPSCDVGEACPVRKSIHLVHDRLIRFLDDVTLAEIAANASPQSDTPAKRETSKVASA